MTVIALLLKAKNIISFNFMLHIYMLKHSSFIQVKCNLFPMGTILLTFKRNKTLLPEAVSRFSRRTVLHRIQLQIYRGNTKPSIY